MPTTRWPKVRTCALFESTARSTEKLSCAVTARMPGTLLAAIATPRPVPQMSSARSASPSATSSAAAMATCGVRGVAVGVDADVDDRLDQRRWLAQVLPSGPPCSRSRRRRRR